MHSNLISSKNLLYLSSSNDSFNICISHTDDIHAIIFKCEQTQHIYYVKIQIPYTLDWECKQAREKKKEARRK